MTTIKKRLLSLTSIIIAVLLTLAGCKSNSATETVTEKTNVSEIEEISYDSDSSTSIVDSSASKDNKETDLSQNDVGGAVAGLLKYRACYYNVPKPFADLVDKKTYNEWSDEYLESYDGNQGYNDGMAIKAFVQQFDISREQFDKANLELARLIKSINGKPCMNPKDFANQETDEVYNGDIIYTFDDEIINEYYMGHPEEFYPYWYADEFEKAVEEGYTPRTTDWIDVDRMEADIIAKYGSVD